MCITGLMHTIAGALDQAIVLIWTSTGKRASRPRLRTIGRGSIFFENVRVPLNHRLGDENKAFVQVMQGFDYSRSLIGLKCLAVARAALDETWAYITQRQAFGQPLSAFQGVIHPLAQFDAEVEGAWLLCLQGL